MTNKKLDNKGFSLVELIIVIAIMAILVGVVGTQVIPYIEKSRRSKDQQVMSGFCTDVLAAASTIASKLSPAAQYKVTVTPDGTGEATVTVSGDSGALGINDLAAELCELKGGTSPSGATFKVKLKWESKSAGSPNSGKGAVLTCLYNQKADANGFAGCWVGFNPTDVPETEIAPVSSK